MFKFNKKSKGKFDKQVKAITEWLSDDANNIWTWQADNIKVEKAVDFAGTVTKAVAKALEGDDNNEGISLREILDAVMDADGVTPAELFKALDVLKEEDDQPAELQEVAA